MPVRFFLDGFHRSLERTMQTPPLFTPRGGGKTRGYKYTAAGCDCRYCIHWFNPIVHLMSKAIDMLCEILCDAKAARSTDADTRQN